MKFDKNRCGKQNCVLFFFFFFFFIYCLQSIVIVTTNFRLTEIISVQIGQRQLIRNTLVRELEQTAAHKTELKEEVLLHGLSGLLFILDVSSFWLLECTYLTI